MQFAERSSRMYINRRNQGQEPIPGNAPSGLSGLRFWLTIAVILAFCMPAWSQGNLGGLTGHVTDPSGAAAPGASGRRQIQNFIYLTPGVTGDQWGTSINGSPGMSAEILIDGGDMQNIGAPGFIAEQAPPYEAVTEFKVQNALYPAEYG